jgi:signal transduction histidine kinase/Flp pilus assembly protein TadD
MYLIRSTSKPESEIVEPHRHTGVLQTLLKYDTMTKTITSKFRGAILLLILVLSCPVDSICQAKLSLWRENLNHHRADSIKVEAYLYISEYYRYSNADSAFWYLSKGLREFTEKNYSYGIARINTELGISEVDHGDLDMAKSKLEEAQELFERLHDKRGICGVTNELGVIEGHRGNFALATAKFVEALKIAQESKYDVGILNSYTNLGMVNELTGNFPAALENFYKAVATIHDSANIRVYCNLFNNIGTVYGRMNDLDKAQDIFESARSKSDTGEYVDVHIISLVNLGIVYNSKGREKDALAVLDEALRLAIARHMPKDQGQALINKANVVGHHDPAKAISILNEALTIGKTLGDQSLLEDAYNNILEYHQALGHYKEMTSLLQGEMALKDSLYNAEKSREITNIQALNDIERARSKIQALEHGVKVQQVKRNIFATTAVCLFIILVVVAVYLRVTRKLYAEVTRQKEELIASNAIKNKLFSIIGHDLRGPVGNIKSLLGVIELEDDPRSLKEFAHVLSEQTDSTLTTLDSLLLWGKSQIRHNADGTTFSPKDYINQNLRLLAVSASNKNISMSSDVSDDLKVKGDPAHFDFIIRNLLANAIKFSFDGGSVRVSVLPGAQIGHIVFRVSDKGLGIAKEKLSNLFDNGGQVSRGTAGEAGNGLGLMLCKEFVTLNGGKIWVESESGAGTDFYFSFPATA